MSPTGIQFLILAACCVLPQLGARPAHDEEESLQSKNVQPQPKYWLMADDKANTNENNVQNTQSILENIRKINQNLIKPLRQQISNNKHHDDSITDPLYTLDEETLNKLQQAINVRELQPTPELKDDEKVINAKNLRDNHSRALHPYMFSQSYPFIMPQVMYNPYLPYSSLIYKNMVDYAPFNYNDIMSPSNDNFRYTRQTPSLPFQIPWPLAPFFPILIKDPLLALIQGGGINNIFEYGQNADVCSKQQTKQLRANIETGSDVLQYDSDALQGLPKREGRAISKRTVPSYSERQDVGKPDNRKQKKGLKNKVLKKPSPEQDISTNDKYEILNQYKKRDPAEEENLRFPISDFGWFGNKKPVAPSPGFFINTLKVHRGGVAIAGPGGVATAGRGGTAVVGPGGLAYTQPGGLAIAGPAARVAALPASDLADLISRLQLAHAAVDGTTNRKLDPIPEANAVQTRREKESKFEMLLSPVAHAVAGARGVAVAAPLSVALAGPGAGSMRHAPQAVAVAGPGGLAIAHSDFLASINNSVSYLPFYGGAKGQYLEVTKNQEGAVVQERIVSEENINSENIVKNNDDNLLSKVLSANLHTLRVQAANLLTLHSRAKKAEQLGDREKQEYKQKLLSVGETAANLVKLIDEIGEDVDLLFRTNSNIKQQNYEDDVGEEGVGIDMPTSDLSDLGDLAAALGNTNIAEAKPVGLAIVGENGLAASRPVATAVAASGIALARPVATAVAGLDPAALGIAFQINQRQ